MNIEDLPYGVCGVYCGQCPSGNGKIRSLAGNLIRYTADLTSDKPDFEIKEFDVKEFREGLRWFHESYGCPTCLKIKEPWCEVMKCEQAKKIREYLTLLAIIAGMQLTILLYFKEKGIGLVIPVISLCLVIAALEIILLYGLGTPWERFGEITIKGMRKQRSMIQLFTIISLFLVLVSIAEINQS